MARARALVVGRVGVAAVVAQCGRPVAGLRRGRRGRRGGCRLSWGRWGLAARASGRRCDVALVGDPPVGGDGPLSCRQGDGVLADQGMELVLDDVLDPGPFGTVVGLRPEVGLRAGGTAELQGDEVVLLVVPGGGVTLVRVAGGELLLFEPGREGRGWPDRRGPSRGADRLGDVVLGDRWVGRTWCAGAIGQDGAGGVEGDAAGGVGRDRAGCRWRGRRSNGLGWGYCSGSGQWRGRA